METGNGDADFQERPQGGAGGGPRARGELLRSWVGGGAVCSPSLGCAWRPASATDPGQPALALRQGRAKLGWAGIDRRSDKSIDFCAEKLIDLLLAPRTREPPAGGAGDTSVQGRPCTRKAPLVPSTSQRTGPSPFTPRASCLGKGKEEESWGRDSKGTHEGSLRGGEFSHQGSRTHLPPNSPRKRRETDPPSEPEFRKVARQRRSPRGDCPFHDDFVWNQGT